MMTRMLLLHIYEECHHPSLWLPMSMDNELADNGTMNGYLGGHGRKMEDASSKGKAGLVGRDGQGSRGGRRRHLGHVCERHEEQGRSGVYGHVP